MNIVMNIIGVLLLTLFSIAISFVYNLYYFIKENKKIKKRAKYIKNAKSIDKNIMYLKESLEIVNKYDFKHRENKMLINSLNLFLKLFDEHYRECEELSGLYESTIQTIHDTIETLAIHQRLHYEENQEEIRNLFLSTHNLLQKDIIDLHQTKTSEMEIVLSNLNQDKRVVQEIKKMNEKRRKSFHD